MVYILLSINIATEYEYYWFILASYIHVHAPYAMSLLYLQVIVDIVWYTSYDKTHKNIIPL
jgi:hypothetical protein